MHGWSNCGKTHLGIVTESLEDYPTKQQICIIKEKKKNDYRVFHRLLLTANISSLKK